MFMEKDKLKRRNGNLIGIFENQYKNGLPLSVVLPGNQTRRFTHISDTIKVCFTAWKNKNVLITALLTENLLN